MTNFRFELSAMIVGLVVLSSSGGMLVSAGVIGATTPVTAGIFGILAALGTAMAIVEIRRSLAARRRHRHAAAARARKAAADKPVTGNRMSWAERIAD